MKDFIADVIKTVVVLTTGGSAFRMDYSHYIDSSRWYKKGEIISTKKATKIPNYCTNSLVKSK